MLAGVSIGLRDYPGRGVADAEVEDFSLGDEVVEGLH